MTHGATARGRAALVAIGVVAAAGCSRTSATTVGPFVRDLAIDAREVRVTSCALVLAREDALWEVRLDRSLPGASPDAEVQLRDAECRTSSVPRSTAGRREEGSR